MTVFKVLALNVRGLRDNVKRRAPLKIDSWLDVPAFPSFQMKILQQTVQQYLKSSLFNETFFYTDTFFCAHNIKTFFSCFGCCYCCCCCWGNVLLLNRLHRTTGWIVSACKDVNRKQVLTLLLQRLFRNNWAISRVLIGRKLLCDLWAEYIDQGIYVMMARFNQKRKVKTVSVIVRSSNRRN